MVGLHIVYWEEVGSNRQETCKYKQYGKFIVKLKEGNDFSFEVPRAYLNG